MISWAQRSSTWARSGSSICRRSGNSSFTSSAGTPSTSALQGVGQVDAALLAHLADRLAHVGQQQLGQRMALPDVVLGLALGQVAGDFQVQAQRGQVVAEQVVQFARDAHALAHARAFGQQGAGGAQFGIEPSLFLAGLGLLLRDQAGDEGEARIADVQHRLQHGEAPA